MTLTLHWFLPSHGDGREISGAPGQAERSARREIDIAYLRQVAVAAEQVGFDGALVPFGLFCEDPWLVSTALAADTRRLKFMIALRPGLMSPTLVAQMCATFQRLSGNRLMLNIVAGGDPEEQARYGDHLPHDARYKRTAEFLQILRGACEGRVDLDGTHLRVRGATVIRPPEQLPTIFVGGSSEAALQVAAEHADVFLCWGEPPPAVGALVDRFRGAAAQAGRAVPAGTRLHVITRERAADAWAEAERTLARLDPDVVRRAQSRFAQADSEGQRRMTALHGGSAADLEVYPNLWAGWGLARQGAGLALVGSYEQVAERIAEYYRLGTEHLILSGQPHVEEAYQFGEGVIPLLHDLGVVAPAESAPDAAAPDTAAPGSAAPERGRALVATR